MNKFYRDSKSQGYKCSKDTLHNYLTYLEDAFCFSLVTIFSDSLRKRQVNYKKIYAIDHGLVTGIVSSISYNTGRLLETMVYNQLRRQHSNEEIFYYKTSNNREIDFITIKQGKVHMLIQVVEILVEPRTKARELDSLWLAMQELNVLEATIITRNEEDMFKKNKYNIRVIPFWKWALIS